MSQQLVPSPAPRTMSLRRMVWPPPVRRVLVLLALALAVAGSMTVGPAAPASAAVTYTSTPINLALNLPVFVDAGNTYSPPGYPPGSIPGYLPGSTYYPINLPYAVTQPPPPADPPGQSPVWQHPSTASPDTFYMTAGEHRRVSEQLDVSVTSSDGNGAEIDNEILCLDPNNQLLNENRVDKLTSSGTNNRDLAGQHFVWWLSMVITADVTGQYTCGIGVQTGTGHADRDPHYQVKVWPVEPDDAFNGTWLKVSNANEAGAQQFDYAAYNNGWCTPADNPSGSGDATHFGEAPCHYFGGLYTSVFGDYRQLNPPVADVLNSPAIDRWTASNDATNVDAVGTFMLTTCPWGTSSCKQAEWAANGYAEVSSYLELDQLNADYSVCQVNRAYGNALGQDTSDFVIDDATHHMPLTYDLTAPVSQNCGGSRLFQLDLHFQWRSGNAVKIDGGNVNVINSVRATPTTVPAVLGWTQAQADNAFAAAGLNVAPTLVMSASPVGTVLSENSPGWTVEPAGSTVQITVSNGQVTVPNVLSWDQASAQQAIWNAGLNVGNVSHNNNCVDPGSVLVQNPSGGAQVPVGSYVNITVSTCTSSGGGGGSGGGGSGGGGRNPILPK